MQKIKKSKGAANGGMIFYGWFHAILSLSLEYMTGTNMIYIYIYIYMCVCVYVWIILYIYIYIYICKSRRKRKWKKKTSHSYESIFIYFFPDHWLYKLEKLRYKLLLQIKEKLIKYDVLYFYFLLDWIWEMRQVFGKIIWVPWQIVKSYPCLI